MADLPWVPAWSGTLCPAVRLLVPVSKHRIFPDSSLPVESTKLVLAGLYLYSEHISSGRGHREVAPF
jgi:hypothetical protein